MGFWLDFFRNVVKSIYTQTIRVLWYRTVTVSFPLGVSYRTELVRVLDAVPWGIQRVASTTWHPSTSLHLPRARKSQHRRRGILDIIHCAHVQLSILKLRGSRRTLKHKTEKPYSKHIQMSTVPLVPMDPNSPPPLRCGLWPTVYGGDHTLWLAGKVWKPGWKWGMGSRVGATWCPWNRDLWLSVSEDWSSVRGPGWCQYNEGLAPGDGVISRYSVKNWLDASWRSWVETNRLMMEFRIEA